jgi:hypothetical protein
MKREAVMSGSEALLAIFDLEAFLLGVVIGVIIMVAVASRREDKRLSLTREAPDAATRGARMVTGAGSRHIDYSAYGPGRER